MTSRLMAHYLTFNELGEREKEAIFVGNMPILRPLYASSPICVSRYRSALRVSPSNRAA